ncbi:PREDICTED: regucalcin-like [Nicrophorus vespilloides]|uniref:Regucalcin-like n=1 Tax=Nicrophorus vespilloides TaxID=110193 RepID=A0ABM1NEX9_NICVS|nr:PREDICTED: regucalcin-like [Nicrophorus vespilloides]
MQIQQIHIAGATELGEGPHWDQRTQSLYYVDIIGKTIHKYTPATEKHSKAQLDENVSIIIPKDGEPEKFIVTMNRKIVDIEWDGTSPNVKNIKILTEVDKENSVNTNRINDGKCDPKGRLWFGTMGGQQMNWQKATNSGSLFSMDSKCNVTKHVNNICLSNGLTWNADRTKFYYIDSMKFTIDEYDYDDESGKIGNGRAIFTLSLNNIEGIADGMTIDTDGNLWVAIFKSFLVIQIDPRKPETLLRTVKIPAKLVTSVAWGGENLDELYVTSGKFTMDNVVLDAKEGHGGLFVIKGLGARGLPMTDYKI